MTTNTYASTQHPVPGGFIESATVTHEGRAYTSGGAVVTDDVLACYPRAPLAGGPVPSGERGEVAMGDMSQPKWELIDNLGDASPIDYGGYFVFRDTTGVYEAEAELLESPDDDDSPEGWTVHRIVLARCTLTDGILSDNPAHPLYPAWFATPEERRATRPQDTTYLANVARTMDYPLDELTEDLCSADPIDRANAYRAIGDYHGWANLDSYPLTFHNRAEVEARYKDVLGGGKPCST